MPGSSSSDGLQDYTLESVQSMDFGNVDTRTSIPRAQSYRNVYTPYSVNLPPSQCFPRKRYIIMPPSNTQRSAVRYVRPLPSREISQKRIITISSNKRQNWASSEAASSSSSSRPQYVLKINRPRSEDLTMPSSRKVTLNDSLNNVDNSIPLHIPTVPPSMSIGAEYTEEEVDEQDECPDVVDSSSYAYYQSVIRPKPEQMQYNCMELDCFWRGSSLAALKRHTNTAHPSKQVQMMLANKKIVSSAEKPPSKPKGVRCSECDALAYSRPLLLKHMTNTHGFEAPLINRTFESREELQLWLEELRSTHAVEFVVSSGSKKWGYGLQVHYLTCSRSGDQKERPNKKYARPPRPSIKCGKNCMAYLKIKQNPVTSVLQIEGCLYHSGHLIDGSMIKLTTAEQRKIATVQEQYERNHLHWDTENMGAVREILGSAGRFRLISDSSLALLLHDWIKELRLKSVPKVEAEPYFNSISHHAIKFEDPESFDLFPNDMILENFSDDYNESSLLSDTQ